MKILTLDPVAYVVVAEVLIGPVAEPVFGGGPFCSIDCAIEGVRELAVGLGIQEEGASFLVQDLDRPVGFVVGRGGRMWAVQILSSAELVSRN
ncbi:hypothetical protein [Streptomyces sp. 769]|uniref:hypothetical protein n=1 Tax=Streptomyces sp. 769 TaxID=1262452 RepID=UPI00057EBBBB|nr:hypothetical protein [Streptomyces sp. 769]AJC58611.1 hypothetical protein GZL_06038 [Streptomyces sp. 769]